MKKHIEALNKIETQNADVKDAIAKSIQRIETTTMTDKAANHLVSFCLVASRSEIAFDSDIVLKNVYAVEKAKKIVQALSAKSSAFIDKYTNAVTYNALKRTKSKALNNAEMNATICASLECETLTATMQRLHKAESTATTQASSSRVALHHLRIATHNASDKTIAFNDTDNAQSFLSLFAKK